jgi:hypothetical protein
MTGEPREEIAPQLRRWAFPIYSLFLIAMVLVATRTAIAERWYERENYEERVSERLGQVDEIVTGYSQRSIDFSKFALSDFLVIELRHCSDPFPDTNSDPHCAAIVQSWPAQRWKSPIYGYLPSQDGFRWFVDAIAPAVQKFISAKDPESADTLKQELRAARASHDPLPMISAERIAEFAQKMRDFLAAPDASRRVAIWALYGAAPRSLVANHGVIGPGGGSTSLIRMEENSHRYDFNAYKSYLFTFLVTEAQNTDFVSKIHNLHVGWLQTVASGSLDTGTEQSIHVGAFDVGLDQLDIGIGIVMLFSYAAFCTIYVNALRSTSTAIVGATFPAFGYLIGGRPARAGTHAGTTLGWLIFALVPTTACVTMTVIVMWPAIIGRGQDFLDEVCAIGRADTGETYSCGTRPLVLMACGAAIFTLTAWLLREEESHVAGKARHIGKPPRLHWALLIASAIGIWVAERVDLGSFTQSPSQNCT